MVLGSRAVRYGAQVEQFDGAVAVDTIAHLRHLDVHIRMEITSPWSPHLLPQH